MKVSINCFLEKDIFPVRSLIQCARKCAAQNECDGLQLHSLLNTSETGSCLEKEECDGGNATAECVFLLRSEFLEAKQYQQNTVIIAKHGRIKPQNVKECYPPPTKELSLPTKELPLPTIPTTTSSVCKIFGAVFINMIKEIWLFSDLWLYIYNSSDMLGTDDFRRRPIKEVFTDLPGPVTAGYAKDNRVYLIVGSNVFTYSTLWYASSTKRETVYEHFRPDVPNRIDGLIVNGSSIQIFSRNYVYDASNDHMVIRPFPSRNMYNPYRSTYKNNQPNSIDAVTGIGPDTFLFISKQSYYLFKISTLKKDKHAGLWIKGKQNLKC
ncbi:unnamed protein product [Mytilus coruscus]|uniref:Uncharacterized protein n=1 Tax=Mytilus coruscus TaxID=42192 RepID=A0A6J8D0W3_MYTCO|nr:unnamed protein product [Mytilus coruscus]